MKNVKLNLTIEISQELASEVANLTAMDGEVNQKVLAQFLDYKNKPDNLSDLDNSF